MDYLGFFTPHDKLMVVFAVIATLWFLHYEQSEVPTFVRGLIEKFTNLFPKRVAEFMQFAILQCDYCTSIHLSTFFLTLIGIEKGLFSLHPFDIFVMYGHIAIGALFFGFLISKILIYIPLYIEAVYNLISTKNAVLSQQLTQSIIPDDEQGSKE